MSRLYGALAVLIFIAAMVITDFIYHTSVTDKLMNELDTAVFSARQQKTDDAKKHIKNCLDALDDNRGVLYLFSSHCRPEELTQHIERAEEYLDNGDTTSFMVYCRLAGRLAQDMNELEYPTIRNIL